MRSNYLFYLFGFTLEESDSSFKLLEPVGSYSSWSEIVDMNSFHTCLYQDYPLPCVPWLSFPTGHKSYLFFLHCCVVYYFCLWLIGKAHTSMLQTLIIISMTSYMYVAFGTWHKLTYLIFPAIKWTRFYYYVPCYIWILKHIELNKLPQITSLVSDRARI